MAKKAVGKKDDNDGWTKKYWQLCSAGIEKFICRKKYRNRLGSVDSRLSNPSSVLK